MDSSAFLAMINPRDGSHAAALQIQRRLTSERWQLVTSNFARAEAHALILGRMGRDPAWRFIETLARGRIALVRVESEDESAAVEILRRYQDKDFSLTDATSFVLMERLRVPWAFSFDSDFSRYGISVVP